MLGREQSGWLASRLIQSPARWNVLAQQVMFGMVDRTAGEDSRYAMDQWPGYLAERRRLLEFMSDRRVSNPVILTGDIHSNWVNDLRADDRTVDDVASADRRVSSAAHFTFEHGRSGAYRV